MVAGWNPFFALKHRFHILHFPNSTGLFTKPTGRHYTKWRFSPDIALDDGSAPDTRDSLREHHISRFSLETNIVEDIIRSKKKKSVIESHVGLMLWAWVNCWTTQNHHKGLFFGCCVASSHEHSSQCQISWGSLAHYLLPGWCCHLMMGLFLQFFAHPLWSNTCLQV